MNTRLTVATLWLGLCALSHGAAGQDIASSVDEEPAPEFEVEVIVFEYVSGAVGAREDWQYIDTGREQVRAQLERDQSLLALPDEVDEPDTSADDAEPAAEQKPLIWTPINSDQRNLSEAFARMRNSRDFRPLVHAAWTQTVYGESDMTTLALDRVARVPGGLNASASLYVERFLHLTLDLELAKPVGPDQSAGTTSNSVTYRLSEKRKMRSGETHFFDHPRFGAVALISKPRSESTAVTP